MTYRQRFPFLTVAALSAAALLLPALGCSEPSASEGADAERTFEYPAAERSDQVDDYHGVAVADPYRWMEEEDSDATRGWIAEQDRLFQAYATRSGSLDGLQRRIGGMSAFDRYGQPLRAGEFYFTTYTPAGKRHPIVVWQRGLNGKQRELFDSAEMLGDPDHGFGGISPSKDGSLVAFASTSPKGWGWMEILRVADGKKIDGTFDGIAGASAVWTHDNAGFFYLRYGKYDALEAGTEARPALYYHEIGTKQAADKLLYQSAASGGALLGHKLSDDGRYLVLSVFAGGRSENRVLYRDLQDREDRWITLVEEADASYVFEGNEGRRFLFQTTFEAPRGRLVAVDLDRPARSEWVEVLPEREEPLASVSHIGDRWVVQSVRDAKPIVELYRSDGTLEKKLDLPTIGLLSGFSDDPESDEAFYSLNSLHDPGTIYRVNLKTGKSKVFRRPDLAHDPDDFVIEQVFFTASDGARVPMFIAHRKGLERSADNPLLMYGYGHGGWVAFPWYQTHLVEWMKLGGVYALPGIRGGGEYGTEWQAAGTKHNKQRTIDDFIEASEWLIEQGYTSANRLVANGGSASGVLAAAAVVQRPELYGAALIEFPFLDMLRYQHFQVIKGWTSGYGSAEVAEDFEVLRRYSPLHNLEPGACYPAVLTVIAGEDSSTVPMHGYKFTAALQAAQGCDRPAMLKTIPGVGHYSYGADPDERAENLAEIIGFLIEALDLDWEVPAKG